MSDAMSRDDLVIAVNRLMICAMEDIDCGRDEAGPTTLDLVERIERHDAALRAENKRLAEALREIDARTGHFGEAPPPPEWMPMLSLLAWVGRTARAALAEYRDAKAAAPEGEKEGERGK